MKVVQDIYFEQSVCISLSLSEESNVVYISLSEEGNILPKDLRACYLAFINTTYVKQQCDFFFKFTEYRHKIKQ